MAQTEPLDLSLVLACYNEEAVFSDSVSQIIETLDQTRLAYEIIFVDDCSRDKTRQLIDEVIAAHPEHNLCRIFHQKNKGRGGTVTDGFRAARGRVTGYIDIDLEVHARYVPACVLAIQKGADVALGLRIYRFQPRSLDRFILSKGYHWLVARVLGIDPALDTETGFKFFNRERILPVLDECEDKGWFWDTEIVTRSYLHGYRIAQVPALFLRRRDKKSTVNPLKDSLEYFDRLWQFRKKLRNQQRQYA